MSYSVNRKLQLISYSSKSRRIDAIWSDAFLVRFNRSVQQIDASATALSQKSMPDIFDCNLKTN